MERQDADSIKRGQDQRSPRGQPIGGRPVLSPTRFFIGLAQRHFRRTHLRMKTVPSLSHALDVAINAAREAGDLLRAELHRPGGPRGAGDHADADTEAESLVRVRLREAFPQHALVGEEQGTQPGTPPSLTAPVWLVDPNDGTRAFLKGSRGSAVSIALLVDGLPVLGVVHVFAAPDDSGELFAWAQGCGPLTVNGVPAIRPPWDSSLQRQHVVLAPMNLQAKTEALTLRITPARFHCLPSIAARLAFVAAGRAEAAFSVGGLVGWDFAAGHALLLGAGGDLLDGEGDPIRYSTGGASSSDAVVGGGGGTLHALRQVDWAGLHRAPKTIQWPLVALRRREPDVGRLQRAQGCLLGQLTGDTLGALVEFQSPRSIAARHPQGLREITDGGPWRILAGQPTDDSELALMLARSLVRQGRFDLEDVATGYAEWYGSAPFDIGVTTDQALAPGWSAYKDGRPVAPECQAAASLRSEANGALMRVSPLGIHGAGHDRESLAAWARADASLTHPNPCCQQASALMACTLAEAIHAGGDCVGLHRFALGLANQWGVEDRLRAAVEDARRGPPEDYLTQQGWVLIAVRNAFHQLLHADNLEEGVVASVMAGGDTDTNACIAGALLGAVHGRDAVPARWRDAVLTCRPLNGLPTVEKPRPPQFWPTDAMVLAEALLDPK